MNNPRRGLWNTATLKTARRTTNLHNGRRDWYRLTNLADAPVPSAELYIYDEIGWFGVSANDLVNQLRDLAVDEISLRLNSPGGEIFDGIAIYQALKSHQAKVKVQVDSIAASIASVIAMAGDEIVMGPFAQMMIHDGLGAVVGNAAEMREMADLLDRQSDNIAAIYQARAGGQTRTWRNRMKAETWYSAQEAVDAGLADKVSKPGKAPGKSGGPDEDKPAEDDDKPTGPDAPPEREDDDEDERPTPPEDRWDLTVFRYAGRANSPGPYAAQLPDAPPDAHPAPAPAPDNEWASLAARLTTDEFTRLREGLLR